MARVSVFLALALVLGLVASALAGTIVVQSATTVSINGAAAVSGPINYPLNGNSPLTISCSTTGAACNYNSDLTITDTSGNAVTVTNTVGFNSISFTAGAGTTFAVSAGATLTSTTTVTLSAVSTISGTFVSTGVATIGGTLTVASTGTLTLNSATTSTINAASTISGSLTGSASVTFTSTVTDNSVGATLNVGGLVFQNNVNLVAASTVTAGSAGLQISGGSAAIAAPITSGGNVAISTTGTNTINLSGNLAITGSLALSGASTGLYTIGGTTVTGSTTFSDTHSGALTFSATTATFGTGVTISTTGAATISGAITATTGNILVNPTGAIALTGSLKANAGAASITLNAGAASTITGAANVNSLDAALLQFGPNVGNAFSGTTYTISGANIKFGTSIVFNAPTSFVNSALVTPSWSVTVSGGSAVSGPASVFTQTFASNVISSSLFPNGINTNCIQFDADASITSFLISLPGAIAYRNLGKYTWGALTVTSTSAGAVTFCTPTITSTMDRRNDVHKNDLVYYGGQVVYFLSFSAALPFGFISATDFSVVGGTISSVSSLSATTWAIVVQITCDGVVSLNYNGSFTGGSVTSTYQSIVTQSNVRVVSAKCIANIYAPCS